MYAIPRLCVASTGGGAGKTLFSLGLIRAFKQKGYFVKPYKKGPDFIDSLWLSQAAGCAATNLDPFLLSTAQLRKLFCQSWQTASKPEKIPSLAIIEGNRGLYDGLDAAGSCSTAQVARTLGCPVLLCIDCRKATRTIAAIIKGLINFEPGLHFIGIALNNIGSTRHKLALLEALSGAVELPILGALPRLARNPIVERHMGLSSQEPNSRHSDILARLAQWVNASCDLETIYAKAATAPPLPSFKADSAPPSLQTGAKPRIGILRDKALWFYYPENLQALQEAGASLVFLSLFGESAREKEKWKSVHGLYLGGGFPEDHLTEISASTILGRIRVCAQNRMPIYAECGGMLLLARSMRKDNKSHILSGVLPCDIEWTRRPQGLGYLEGTIVTANPWFETGQRLRGHEFHYSRCVWNTPPDCALRLFRGKGVIREDGINYDGVILNNIWASYAHIFAPATPQWAPGFTRLATDFKRHGQPISI